MFVRRECDVQQKLGEGRGLVDRRVWAGERFLPAFCLRCMSGAEDILGHTVAVVATYRVCMCSTREGAEQEGRCTCFYII